jgi:integrase/recombinase XerD
VSAVSTLFEQFVRERRYLKNVTPKTVIWYEAAFQAFSRAVSVAELCDLSKPVLHEFVVALRERGVAPVSCNTYLKALNAFFAWLHAEGHLSKPLALAPQRTEKRVLQILSTEQLQRLLAFKPKTTAQWRAYVLACTLMDSGIRIGEALGVREGDVDLDNLLLKVRGKGRKERLVPISFELRRVLFRWTQVRERGRWRSDWLFATRAGTKLQQRNALRAHYALLKRVDVPQSGFHRLRHTFATSYLQNGGDVVRLSRVLGHSHPLSMRSESGDHMRSSGMVRTASRVLGSWKCPSKRDSRTASVPMSKSRARHLRPSNSPILNPVAAMRLTIVRCGSPTCFGDCKKGDQVLAG